MTARLSRGLRRGFLPFGAFAMALLLAPAVHSASESGAAPAQAEAAPAVTESESNDATASAASPASQPVAKADEPTPGAEPLTAISLEELEARLVDTDAIGFFTKLELKSQLDDLTERFREFHDAADSDELPQLREEFNGLLLKLLTLLQDEDPDLHRDLARARPQIWRTFSDPVLFAKL
ncbi:MAG: hypothetical protein AAF458_09140 [Pseudomonadota bacterium]